MWVEKTDYRIKGYVYQYCVPFTALVTLFIYISVPKSSNVLTVLYTIFEH